MNGRVYDYNVARFTSVDPFIQGTGSQAMNPYSYIQNNPLSGTDPSGYATCTKDDAAGCNVQTETKIVSVGKTGSRIKRDVTVQSASITFDNGSTMTGTRVNDGATSFSTTGGTIQAKSGSYTGGTQAPTSTGAGSLDRIIDDNQLIGDVSNSPATLTSSLDRIKNLDKFNIEADETVQNPNEAIAYYKKMLGQMLQTDYLNQLVKNRLDITTKLVLSEEGKTEVDGYNEIIYFRINQAPNYQLGYSESDGFDVLIKSTVFRNLAHEVMHVYKRHKPSNSYEQGILKEAEAIIGENVIMKQWANRFNIRNIGQRISHQSYSQSDFEKFRLGDEYAIKY